MGLGTTHDGGRPGGPAPEWRTFEEAVATFLQALDPAAAVTHNLYTEDLDTGLKRQRDVWIESRALGGAGGPQLAGEGADLPNVLAFSGYIFRERIAFELQGATYAEVTEAREAPESVEPDGRSVLAGLIAHYESQGLSVETVMDAQPPTWGSQVTLASEEEPPVVTRLRPGWEVFRANQEACLLNGPYSFTDETFAGGMSMPWIDTFSDHPGPGWEKISILEVERSRPQIAFVTYCNELEAAVRAPVAKMAGAEVGVVPAKHPSSS